MRRKEKVIVGLSVGAAALFLIIALCVSGGEDEEARPPELELAVVAGPAAESRPRPPAEEPQVVRPFWAEFERSFEDAIEPDPLPAAVVAPAVEKPREPAIRETAAPAEEQKGPEREPARYLVTPGETYYSIAKKVYGSAGYFLDIELANGIEPHRLKAGQRIVIPRMEGVELSLPEQEPQRRDPEVREYTIQRGDTLGHICLELYGTSKVWKKLVEANPGLDPRRLIPETTIVVPPLGAEGAAPR